GSLLASAILFFVPLSLLAMVGPFFVRVLTVSVSGVGGNVGRLTALSTLGSFVGTVLIGYVPIPFFPNAYTMYFTALLLMLIAGVYFFVCDFKSRSRPAGVTAVLFGVLGGYAVVRGDNISSSSVWIERLRGNSNFGVL